MSDNLSGDEHKLDVIKTLCDSAAMASTKLRVLTSVIERLTPIADGIDNDRLDEFLDVLLGECKSLNCLCGEHTELARELSNAILDN